MVLLSDYSVFEFGLVSCLIKVFLSWCVVIFIEKLGTFATAIFLKGLSLVSIATKRVHFS